MATIPILNPRRLYVERTLECRSYNASQLVELMMLIASGKQTGSLTINFSQGAIAGTVLWKQMEATQEIPIDTPPTPP